MVLTPASTLVISSTRVPANGRLPGTAVPAADAKFLVEYMVLPSPLRAQLLARSRKEGRVAREI